MFSKKLSSSVLSICDSGDLSYEAAAELCDLSSRYFGDIARGKALLQSFLRDFPGLPSLSLQSGARIPIFL